MSQTSTQVNPVVESTRLHFEDEEASISQNIAVVIPSYKVKSSILEVIGSIPPVVTSIFIVDDACPEGTGNYVRGQCRDPRVKVLNHAVNLGVGGAVVTGYRAALEGGADIVVKIDGDGQMDPYLIPQFIRPIALKSADYVKGNRFFNLESLSKMPMARKIGNTVLSFINKASSGYWDIMDPANGFTAIHVHALKMLPLDKLDRGYFFESDMLFRLNTLRAVVMDWPMRAQYGTETSHLRIGRVLLDFPGKNLNRFFKRIIYNYFLHDFNIGSLELVLGVFLITAGSLFGFLHWFRSSTQGVPATSGTVMLASLPIILGFQSLLATVQYDVSNVPRRPLHALASQP